mgnify:FL=1
MTKAFSIRILYLIIFNALWFTAVSSAKTIYISNSGKDSNNGTFSKPYKTLKKAFSVLESGDSCFIRGGIYHESITINNLNGSLNKPITIAAYNNEVVTVTGTKTIDAKWNLYKDGIYKTKLKNDIWQLFANDLSMSPARWPNGNWNDGSLWDKTQSMAWPEKGKGAYGHHYNAALKTLDFDLTDAIILVNSGSFKTYASLVTEHTPGSDNFKYDTTRKKIRVHFSYKGKVFKHGYFLEGKLGLLDVPGEWFYDPNTKTLYFYPPDNVHPSDMEIKGKNIDYAFKLTKSNHIRIKNINFFGTTISSKESTHLSIENCEFKYPSFNKRMIGDLSSISETKFLTRKKEDLANNKIINCTFEYADGVGLKMTGKKITVENNYIHDIDFSCITGGYTIDMSGASDVKFIRNTVLTGGGSEMYKAGPRHEIAYNNLSQSGHLQNDGSLIQVSVAAQPDSETHHNWVHNTVKQGLRFDNKNTPGAPWGENGTMHHNVAWKTDRIFFKGDNHFIYNNLSFDSHQNDLIISSDTKIQGHNHGTITRNNLANTMSGSRSKPGKDFPVPGIVDHNWSADVKSGDIRDQLRDPDNLDFRPKPNAEIIDSGALIKTKNIQFKGSNPDAGAYEFGDSYYWIPGFKDKTTSSPVPPHNATHVKSNASLMWLEANQSNESLVYFDSNLTAVETANQSSKCFMGSFGSETNVLPLETKNINSGATYYWRVDSKINGKIVKGSIWTFKVK